MDCVHRALKPLLVALLWATCAVPGFEQGGRFDYYLLALSWSPEYCHSHTGSPQCAPGKHFTFVVHGLWPEYNSGSGPEHCGSEPGLSTGPSTELSASNRTQGAGSGAETPLP